MKKAGKKRRAGGAKAARSSKTSRTVPAGTEEKLQLPHLDGNEYLRLYQEAQKAEPDLDRIFSHTLEPEERERLYYEGEDPEVVFKFAWAIPDDRAVKIVAAMSPVVEVGAGRGYWARLVREAGGAVECYDIEPNDKPSENTPHSVPFPNWVHVKQGGPECVLRHPGSTLMLCYPDDFENSEESVALEALRLYKGDTVIHVGELFGQTKCKPGAFGKTTSPDAQVYLASSFHKVLQVPLPSWSSSLDTLSVWKRTAETEIDGSVYADVPKDERLELAVSAPGYAHML